VATDMARLKIPAMSPPVYLVSSFMCLPSRAWIPGSRVRRAQERPCVSLRTWHIFLDNFRVPFRTALTRPVGFPCFHCEACVIYTPQSTITDQ
jgi:ferredoxin